MGCSGEGANFSEPSGAGGAAFGAAARTGETQRDAKAFAKSNFRWVAHDLPVVRARAAARPHPAEMTFGRQDGSRFAARAGANWFLSAAMRRDYSGGAPGQS